MQPIRMQNEESESEDDLDYIPPGNDASHSSDDEPGTKRVKTGPSELSAEAEAEKKRAAEALWASIKASASQQPRNLPPLAKVVKIEKRYRFAGEEVVEVKEVPEDSEDAKKWPRWQPPDEPQKQDPINTSGEGKTPAQSAVSSSTAGPSTSIPPKSSAAKISVGKRPGPRKPKTILAPLPGSQKAKKLTTLDKSAMDWKTHVESVEGASVLKDELEVNRRGGGYLEKVEFLQRVEERKEEALEASRAGKRRRG